MEVQIFGFRDCSETRKAERYFKERRVTVHFVDLAKRAPQPGELRRFAKAYGIAAIIDRASKRFAESGLAGSGMSEERWLEALHERPRLLLTPLVRCGKQVSIGADAERWAGWLATGE